MRPLDDRIRAARPEAPPLPDDFAATVMAEIARRGLVPRPAPRRWPLVAAGAAALLLGVALVNALAFEVRMNGSLEMLYFGQRYAVDFLGRLPYDLLLPALLAAALSGWLFGRARLRRVRLTWAVLASYLVTGVGGVALADSGLNERLQEQAVAESWQMPLVGPFYRHRAHYRRPHPHIRMGRVVSRENGAVILETPDGEQVPAHLPPRFAPEPGEMVRLRGDAVSGRFFAREAQRCDPSRARRYFMGHHRRGGMGPGDMGPGMMGPGMRGMGPGMRGMGPGARSPGAAPMGPPAP